MNGLETLPEPLLYALGASLVVHLLGAGLLWRRLVAGGAPAGGREQRRGVETDGDADALDRIDADAQAVTCPNCGTENELGYRFCRSCVEELPGADGRAAHGVTSGRRSPL